MHMCTHVCKWKKMTPVETTPGVRGGGNKRAWLRR
jgi:hypothetical protein